MEKLTISKDSKVRVIWEAIPLDYSKQNEKQVQELFSKKYDIPKNNVKVIFSPIKISEDGIITKFSDTGLDNVMDQNYQRKLMSEWLDLNNIKVDLKRILKLDDKVNAALSYDYEESANKRWRLKWLKIDNFLSFGDDNSIVLDLYKGFNFVTSNPSNQGGKTNFTVDAVMFLLFGNTTKTTKNEQIFNTHRDKDSVVVKGMLESDSFQNLIVERKLTRKLKTDGKSYTVTNKMAYYELLPDGSEKKLNDEQAKATSKELAKVVGSESDFEIVVCATGDNLEDSIKGTPTQRGSLITRFIGLEPIMKKEDIVRKMFNEYSKTLKGNLFNVVALSDEIVTHESNIEMCEALLEKHETTKKELEFEGDNLKSVRDGLLSKKVKVNDKLVNVNLVTLKNEISEIKDKGVAIKSEIESLNKELKELSGIEYDEDLFMNTSTEKFNLGLKETELEKKITSLEKEIMSLKNDEVCVTCKSPLKDVDNSGIIKSKEILIEETKNELVLTSELKKDKEAYIEANKSKAEQVKTRDKKELERDRKEVEIGRLRNSGTEKINLKKEYELNLDAIEINNSVDNQVSKIDTDIVVNSTSFEKIINQIQNIKNDRQNNQNDITSKSKLIKEIKQEEEILKIYKVYIDMIGRKGISKLVLRSVLPIINSELFRLMDEICDFTLEMKINSKNEVDYNIVKDGVSSSVKSGSGLERTISALAVRVILGRITTLPTPNFIVFDEIMGKVAGDNIEKMKSFFDKITEMYDSIFFISHNDLVKDWADNVISINKDKNVSTFS